MGREACPLFLAFHLRSRNTGTFRSIRPRHIDRRGCLCERLTSNRSYLATVQRVSRDPVMAAPLFSKVPGNVRHEAISGRNRDTSHADVRPRDDSQRFNGGISTLRRSPSLFFRSLATSGNSRATFRTWFGSVLRLYRQGPLPAALPVTFWK